MDSYKSLEKLLIHETGLLSFPEILLPNHNRLQHLSLCDYPNLLSFPEDGLPTTLTSLEIVNCRRLEFLPHEMMAKLTSLDNLQIYYSCESMRSFPFGFFPKLTSLYIWECENLWMVRDLDTSLLFKAYILVGVTVSNSCQERVCRHLFLSCESPNVLLWRKDLRNFPMFRGQSNLCRQPCMISEFKLMVEQVLPARRSRVNGTPVRKVFTPEGRSTREQSSLSKVETGIEQGSKALQRGTKSIVNYFLDLLTMVLKTKGAAHQLIIIECNNLKSLPERIHTLTALRELRIDGLPNLVSFAERGLLPNLRHFSIQNCERLRVLVREHWGLQQLVSLEEFYIGGRASDDILEMLLKEQLLLPLFTL
ncbi:PREDICTED: putative disease resistance [Prunus dulcis]|uniref:PREDICTED: putative disease resistance n=1 Tax=Prunus dulcis TaxID=3755 RepID=A0A5E4F1L9_PRUDU|nr:PREDICTED: putative disease resistance [Prunus dulcis]